MSNYLTYNQIAKQLGVSIDTIRRNVRNFGNELNIQAEKRKTSDSKGALADCLSMNDADVFINFYKLKGETDINKIDFIREYGYFYIIQLVPEFFPDRVKLGFAENLKKRLLEHQTSSPTAILIGNWPCKRFWEQAAIESITRVDCKLVMNEVYEGELKGFIKRAEDFFNLMPTKDFKIELSEHSPLRNQKNNAT